MSPDAVAEQGGPSPWISLVPIASVIFAAFGASVLVTPLYPLFQQKFGISEIVLTLIYAAYVIGNVVSLLFLGRLSDQVGRKVVSLPGLGLTAVGVVVFLFAGSIVSLFFGRLIVGLSVGVLSGTGTAWLAERAGRQRATVMATVANLGGVAFGPLLGGVLACWVPALSEVAIHRLPAWCWLELPCAVARTPESAS